MSGRAPITESGSRAYIETRPRPILTQWFTGQTIHPALAYNVIKDHLASGNENNKGMSG